MVSRDLGEGRAALSGGKEERYMHWYNPKTGEPETVPAPTTDEAALELLLGHRDSGKFLENYVVLREEGMGIEQALMFVGHRFRMLSLRHLNLGRVREPLRSS